MPKATPLQEQLSSSQVEEMLKGNVQWRLALRVDDDTVYVLDRATLYEWDASRMVEFLTAAVA